MVGSLLISGIVVAVLTFSIPIVFGILSSSGRSSLPQLRLAWQPQGRKLAVCCDGWVAVFNDDLELVNQRRDMPQPPDGEITNAISWNSTGTKLVLAYIGGVGVWDLQSDTTTQLPDAFFPAAWSKEDDLVATSSRNHTIQIWNAMTYQLEIALPGFTYSAEQYSDLVYALQWSATGRFLAGQYSSGKVRVWNMQTGEQVFLFEDDARSMSWGADTELAITAKNTLEVWDVETNAQVQSLPVVASLVRWNPTRNRLALLVAGETMEIWEIDSAVRLRQFEDHVRRISDIQWNSEGTILASVDILGRIDLWDVETGNKIKSVQVE